MRFTISWSTFFSILKISDPFQGSFSAVSTPIFATKASFSEFFELDVVFFFFLFVAMLRRSRETCEPNVGSVHVAMILGAVSPATEKLALRPHSHQPETNSLETLNTFGKLEN